MILGMPGSGKRTVIIALLKALTQLKKRVLMISHTTSSCDKLVAELKESGASHFVRVAGSLNSIDSKIVAQTVVPKQFKKMTDVKACIEENFVYACSC